MTEEHARKIISEMLHNVQKARSDGAEFFDSFNPPLSPEVREHMMADLNPWLHGPKGDDLVVALADAASGAKVLDPINLYNFMYIAHRLEPVIGMVATLRGWELPEPDVAWLKGWEAE